MGEAKELTKKKAFKMPHTLVIIFMIIFAAVLFTWVVPSGAYVRFEDAVTGRNLIDPESFHYVENTPVNPLKIMNYVIDGFMDAADLIFMLMFAGGAFHLITESGALQASIAKVARKFSNRFYIFIPMLTLIFTLIATNQGVNLFIPFVPITVMLSFALGLDSLVGVSIILLGGAVGFSTGTLQTSTTLLAQEIAGLVPFSGIWYRAICLVVFWVVTNLFLIRYAMKIKKNPQPHVRSGSSKRDEGFHHRPVLLRRADRTPDRHPGRPGHHLEHHCLWRIEAGLGYGGIRGHVPVAGHRSGPAGRQKLL